MKTVFKCFCVAVAIALLAAAASRYSSGTESGNIQFIQDYRGQTQLETGTGMMWRGIDISSEASLIMYLIGDPPRDASLVYDKLNKLLKRDINATLTVKFIPWWDYDRQYHILIASGEDFDLIYTSNRAFYKELAVKGVFLELTEEMLKNYAPRTWMEVPGDAWEQSKIIGRIYMIPTDVKLADVQGYFIRGDLRAKYGVPEIRSLDDFGLYLDAVVKNERNIVPYNAGTPDIPVFSRIIDYENGWDDGSLMEANLAYCVLDHSCRVFSRTFTSEYEAFAKRAKAWASKGFWTDNVLVNRNGAVNSFLEGKSASAVLSLLDARNLYFQVTSAHPEWKPEWSVCGNGIAPKLAPCINDGIAVNARSAHPERALILLDLFRNNEEYFNLTTYGIKGLHYTLTPNGKIDLPEGTNITINGFPPDSSCSWGWRTWKFLKSPASTYPALDEALKNMTRRAAIPVLTAFVLKQDTIEDRLVNMHALKLEHEIPMNFGIVNDVEKELETYRLLLKEAGIDKVKYEVQRQINVFLRNR